MTLVSLITILLLLGCLTPKRAEALDQSVATVITCGEYGLVGGTFLGLASLSFTKKTRSIFLGSSLGLYAGILAGLYYATHMDDPANPFRSNPEELELIHTRGPSVPNGALQAGDSSKSLLVSFEVLRF